MIIKELEKAIGYKICVPKDFDEMRELIFRRTHQLISSTTLKRIWGYNDEPLKTRDSTFNLLSRALGYAGWEEYRRSVATRGAADSTIASSPVLSRFIDVKAALEPGDMVTLSWYCERRCVIRYLGQLRFEVVEAVNTRLLPGDRFSCHMIVAGEPLYLSGLVRGNNQPLAYICGKSHGGIQFEFSPD